MTVLVTRRFASRTALESALTDRLAHALAAAGAAVPAIMLAGGGTPLPAYRALAARSLLPHHAALRLLFSDDRYVPSDSPQSNYHQVRPLLDALALAPDSVLRVRTELPLEEAACDYDRQLGALLALGSGIGLGLLGLGADGHTASLFSAADLERARGHLALAVQRPDGMAGVSVTPELLARVAEPVFVVADADAGKRAAVGALLAQDPGLTAWRAVQGCPRVELWVTDGD
jgi:6-phosphogluconolactonase